MKGGVNASSDAGLAAREIRQHAATAAIAVRRIEELLAEGRFRPGALALVDLRDAAARLGELLAKVGQGST